MMKMPSVQNIRFSWRLIKPPPLGGAAPSCAAAIPALAASRRVESENVRMKSLAKWGRTGAPGDAGSGKRLEVRLELNEKADDDAEQRDAFDERRENQRVRRDGARDLRLARLRLGGA